MQPRKRGFTLIELLVVIVIIGVLFAVAIPVFENAQRKDTDRAAYQVMTTLRLARQHAINRRQWTIVIFPNRDSSYPNAAQVDKCLRAYAVIAATNELQGTYQFVSNLRDPRVLSPGMDMWFTFVSDWKYLPEGIYFDDDPNLVGNFLFGREGYYTKRFRFPLFPEKPNDAASWTAMSALLFKPNGRLYIMSDSNSSGKFWQDREWGRLYLTSAKYYEKTGLNLSAPVPIPGTNTQIGLENKSGQVAILEQKK